MLTSVDLSFFAAAGYAAKSSGIATSKVAGKLSLRHPFVADVAGDDALRDLDDSNEAMRKP